MADQDGHERVETSVPPAALQTIAAIDQSDLLRRLVKLTEMQIPVGAAPFIRFNGANAVDTTRRELELKPPWFSIEIFNDGAVDLQASINSGAQDPIIILPGESIKFDFDLGIIERVWLQAASGSLPVRLVGTR